MLENYSRLNLYKHLLQNIELFDLIEYIYTTLQVIKNYVFLQPIVHKPLG